MKVLLAQFIYESNTFSPRLADLANFQQGGSWCVGEDAVRAWARSVDSQLTSSLRVLEDAGWETQPVFATMCGSPSGRLTRPCFGAIRETLKQQLLTALPADVIVLHLHGAACAEGEDDVEGNLLEMVREEVGFRGHLVLSLDMHANITRRMVQRANAITAYRTMPHCDFRETGERAARLAMQTQPTVRAVAKIAALIPPTDTNHTEGRFASMLSLASDAEQDPDIFDVSLFPVQPWMDVAEMGSAVVVTGQGKKPLRIARQLAETWYAQRHEWQTGLMEWKFILERLQTPTAKPWILVDTADATTGGSTGGSAEALKRLLPYAHSLAGPVLLYVVDPVAVDAALRGETDFRVGDPPVELDAEVIHTGDGRFHARGKAYHGMEFSMGRIAVLRCGQIHLLVSCDSTLAADPAQYECAGLNPDAALAVQAKSHRGWIAGYEAEANRGLIFDGPGCCSLNFQALPFTRERRRLYPIDDNPPEPIRAEFIPSIVSY